jgi:hypothetical protein
MAGYRKLTMHGGPRDGEVVRYLGAPPVLVFAEIDPPAPEAAMVPIRYHDYVLRPGTCDYDYQVPAWR